MNKISTKYCFKQAAGGNVYQMYIYDDVTAYGDFNWNTWEYDDSETSAKHFREELAAIPDDAQIELHINSNGGEVKEGIAIYNMLKQHKAYKTCYVDGFAYSIASVICMACDKIIMGLGTSMLIHNMSAYVYGNASQLRKMADDLDILMESNRKIYMERLKGVTEEQLSEMMDKETFLTPEQCLEYGLCDEIGTYRAQQDTLLRQSEETIRKMKQQINEQRSFREELKLFTEMKQEEKEELNHVNEKVLKMMSAFFNAIN